LIQSDGGMIAWLVFQANKVGGIKYGMLVVCNKISLKFLWSQNLGGMIWLMFQAKTRWRELSVVWWWCVIQTS